MFETLRAYFQAVPVLADLLDTALHADPGHASNTEDLRFHIEALQAGVRAKLKADRQAYAVIHFPEVEQTCAICQTTYFGYYWELNNPVTNKGMTVTNRLLHGLVAHEQLFCQESMHNVSGTRVGEARLVLDLPALGKVLAGADVPEAVFTELAEAQAAQAQQLQAAGAPPSVAAGGH